MTQVEELTEKVLEFRDERDWEQYHTPHNLSAALSVEVAELQELFLWQDGEEGPVDSDSIEKMSDEIADVLIYGLLFCHEVGIDPAEAVRRKLEKNRRKYPAEKARGRTAKYTELEED